MSSPRDKNLLKQCRLFEGVGMDAIEGIVNTCNIIELLSDEILLTPNQENNCIYVLLEGRLSVHPTNMSTRQVDLENGECVGDPAYLLAAISAFASASASVSTTSPSSIRGPAAYVIAASPSRILALPNEALWSLINRSHGIARNLLNLLANRKPKNEHGIVTHIADYQHFSNAATVDGLTGLHNRLWLDVSFARAMRRCTSDDVALSLLIVDIDQLHVYNEHQGLLAGDEVLRAIAQILVQHLRPTEMLARYSGEKFAILLPGSSVEDALRVAERLRTAIASANVGADLFEEALPLVTISIGVAGMQAGHSLTTLIAQSEAALYQAKCNGRNKVEVASTQSTRMTA